VKNVVFNRTEKGIEMECKIEIKYTQPKGGDDFDLDAARQRSINYSMDLVEAYAPTLIASLERRMCACEQNLIRHLDDIEYADNCGHIVYVRKDKTRGNFNVISFNEMKDAVTALHKGEIEEFLENKPWIDQTLKALLNDTEMHHEDRGNFKYSELMSLLCELHICPYPLACE